VWEGIVEQANVDEITERLTRVYDGNKAVIEADVRRLLADLVAEGLIIPIDDQGADAVDAGSPRAILQAGERRPFVSPVFEKFTDMADLILLDPIHDVGDRGWPYPRADSSDTGS
jgi:hypothetical protein